MKQFYIKIISLILLLGIFNPSVGQQRKFADKYLTLPDIFTEYYKASAMQKIQAGGFDAALLRSTNSYPWIVYSDRKNNVLYSDISFSNSVKGKDGMLDFMEPLYVKEVSYDRVYVCSGVYNTDNNTIEQHKDRGWIHISKLVLSSFALLNETSLPQKAMALISLDSLTTSSLEQYKKEGIARYKFYYGPNSAEEKGQSEKFEIYYVLKEEKGYKLLSRTDKLSGTAKDLQSYVPGWMSNYNITRWDYRICLEPASGKNAENYMGEKIPVFPTFKALELFINKTIPGTDAAIMRFDLASERPVATLMRMPILDNINNELKRVATVGTLEKDKENILKKQAEQEEKILKLNNLLQNIDIMFVIDGTQSMDRYFPSIAASVSGIIQNNNLFGTGYTIRFGLTIYRDYEDDEDACVVMPLTTNYQKIADMLLSTKRFSKDTDLPEAQYNGLVEGIKKAGFDPKHSNIVVLIGDAGNAQPDKQGKTIQQVVNTLNDNNVNLISFQVYQGRDETFSVFNADAQDFLTMVAQKKVAEYSQKNGLKVNVRLQSLAIDNTYKLNFLADAINEPLSDFFMFGRFTYASDIKQMDTAILRKNIESSVFENIKSINNSIAEMRTVIQDRDSDKKFGGKYTEIIKKIICARFNLTDQECDLFLTKIEDFSFVGFTAKAFDGKPDCYDPVVFLSKDEFGKLHQMFVKFRSSRTSVDKIQEFKSSLVQLCLAAIGGGAEEIVLQKTLNEIWKDMLGVGFDVKGRYGNLANIKLRDINSSDPSQKQFLNTFISNFESSLRRFDEGLFKERHFDLANQKFSWIPLNRFPGNE